MVPSIRIASPRDETRLRELLAEAVTVDDAPTMIRFGKGSVGSDLPALRRTSDGVDVLLESPAKDVLLIPVGAMAKTAIDVSSLLAAQGIGATVVDPRWVVPVADSIVDFSRSHRLVVSIEDGVRVGGIGTRIRQTLRAAGVDTPLNELGLPDQFLEHASRDEILQRVGLDAKSIAQDIVAQVLGAKVPYARALDQVDQDLRSL